jgi:hypothetical protein
MTLDIVWHITIVFLIHIRRNFKSISNSRPVTSRCCTIDSCFELEKYEFGKRPVNKIFEEKNMNSIRREKGEVTLRTWAFGLTHPHKTDLKGENFPGLKRTI